MSNYIKDKTKVMLGMGEVYFVDASSSNYSSITSVCTSTNLVSKMANVRLYSKKDSKLSKRLVDGIIQDDELDVIGSEFFVELGFYEYSDIANRIMYGDKIVGSTLPMMGGILKKPAPIRIEVRFKFPAGNNYWWYVFPKCNSITDLDFSPGNSEGFSTKTLFRALPCVDENYAWYSTSTPSFHSYMV